MQSFVSLFVIAISFLCFSVSPVWAKGGFDGPAELPRVTVASSIADTPTPGSITTVRAGGNLQAALDNARCGDTIELQAGATFTGRFLLRAQNCDSGHWIVIRTSASDGLLPAEGQRINPCYAGVASLPGRPTYSCSNRQNVMARIENNTTGDGPFILRTGANHYRLLGLEITRTAGTHTAPALVMVEPKGVADHIVVDRCWFHGTLHDETQTGVSLNGSTNVAVVESYFSDFHCTLPGMCSDAHAVNGGVGSHQDGPFKISNNFLEASGEAVMFGGGAATLTPADIEIRRNHFFKPWQWMPGKPGFVGGTKGQPFVTKNHVELKNATRVLVEANLLENNWGGFTQSGYAILLTPKNQHTNNNGNVCPLCQVTDVTIRYSRISHSGSGIAMATSISGDGKNGGPALAGTRWSIHDVVIEDINKNYVGGGNLFMIENGWPKNPVNTITINHVTGFPDSDGHLSLFANSTRNPAMYGFVFTNNMVVTGRYPIWSAGGGLTSCAAVGTPAQKISKCFSTNTYKNNALIGTPDAFPPASWPTGNFFPTDGNKAGFVQFDNGVNGDYRLQPNSPYKNAGTDGKDLGADIVGLDSALAGVD
jgi:hypothetical protein